MNIQLAIDATKACAGAFLDCARAVHQATEAVGELAANLNAHAIIERRKAAYQRRYRNVGAQMIDRLFDATVQSDPDPHPETDGASYDNI